MPARNSFPALNRVPWLAASKALDPTPPPGRPSHRPFDSLCGPGHCSDALGFPLQPRSRAAAARPEANVLSALFEALQGAIGKARSVQSRRAYDAAE